MSFDAKLILAALDKHFDALEARWDRFFSDQDQRWAKTDAVREASKGVPAPTQYAAVDDQYATVRADAVAGYREDLFDGGGDSDEQRHEELIVANNWGGLFEQPVHFQEERNLEFPDAPAYIEPGPESYFTSTRPVDTTTMSPPITLPATSSPAPRARGADEDNTTNSTPTRCLTNFLSHNMVLLKTICVAPTSTPAAPSAEVEVANNSTTRYISIDPLASSSGAVLLRYAIEVHEAPEVLVGMTSQCLVLPRLLSACVWDLGPWPPPLMMNNTLLTSTGQLYFSLDLSFFYGDEVVKQTPPWPPSIQMDMQKTDVQLRPIPWPSFTSQLVLMQWNRLLPMMFCNSMSKCMDFLIWEFSLECSRHWLEFLKNAFPPARFIWELTANVFRYLSYEDACSLFRIQIQGHFIWMGSLELPWMLFPHCHEPVQWKLSWVFLSCLHMSSCYFVGDSVSRHWMILLILHEFLQSKYCIVDHHKAILDAMIPARCCYGCYECLVCFNRKEALAWGQLTYGSTFIVSESCMWNCRWLMAIFLLCPSCNVYCASCKHKEDRDFVLCILQKISWLFSVSMCWSSEALVPVTVITRAYKQFQYLCNWQRLKSIKSDEGVFQWPILIHQLSSIVAAQHLFLWDPGADQYLFAEFESSHGLADFHMKDIDLSFVKLRGCLVLFQFLSSLHCPSREDSNDILLGYFEREDDGICRLCQIKPPDIFISTRSAKLLGGQHKLFGELMLLIKRCSLQSMSAVQEGHHAFRLVTFGLHTIPWPLLAGGLLVNMEILSKTKTLVSELLEHAREASRLPRVGNTIFKLQFYHLVIEDP